MPQNHDQDNLFNDEPYMDDQGYGAEESPMDFGAYEEGPEEASEDFPEPPAKAKPKPNVALLAGALVGAIALGLGGLYVAAPETLRDMLPEDVIAMLPEGTFPTADAPPADAPMADPAAAPAAEAPVKPHKRKRHHVTPADAAGAAANPSAPADQAAVPADQAAAPDAKSAEFQQPATSGAADAGAAPVVPHKRKRHHAPDAQTAAASAEAPKVAEAPKPKKHPAPAHKVAAAPKPHADGAGRTMFSTAIAFAPHSYWVAAAEVEKLWAISSKAGAGHGGTFVVTTHRGASGDEAEMVGKRSEKLVEMLRRNNPAAGSVTVKSGAPASGSTGFVDVSFVKQL